MQTRSPVQPCAGAAADIWSLGVVLFELLTGEVPFDGDDFAEIGANVMLSAPKALRRYCPDASDELVAIVERCLQKDPAARYPSVEALATDLAAALSNGPANESSQGTRRRAHRPTAPRASTLLLVRRRRSVGPWLGFAAASIAAVLGGILWMKPAKEGVVNAPPVALSASVATAPVSEVQKVAAEEAPQTASESTTVERAIRRPPMTAIAAPKSIPRAASRASLAGDYAEFGGRR